MKRRIAALLAGLITVGMLMGCGATADSSSKASTVGQSTTDGAQNLNATGLPIVNEPITITVMGKKDGGAPEWDNLEIFTRAEEATGIHFEFELYDDEVVYDDKMNLAITTGEYPEVFMRRMTMQNEELNGAQGVFIDLTDLIDKYMPNLKKLMEEDPYLKAAMTTESGEIFSLPYYYKTVGGNPHQVFMYDGWLKEAGFDDVPETVDEFYDLLVALSKLDINGNGDLNDDIPLGAWDVYLQQKFLIPAFTGYTNNFDTGYNFDVDKNGKVVFIPLEPSYREFLEYTNKLYKEKLLDQEIYTQNADQWLAKLKENRCGIFNASPTATDYEKANGKAISLKPLTSSTNPTPVVESMPFLQMGAAVITDKCQNPEAVARWFDLFYAKDDESMAGLNGRTMFAGWRGEHWQFVDEEETTYEWLEPIKSDPQYVRSNITPEMWMPSYLDFEFKPTGNPVFEQKVAGVMENQVPYMRRGLPVSHMRLTAEEAAVRDRVVQEADEYTRQMTAQFIVGALDIDKEYDNFVKNFETIGVPEMIEVYQGAYDRWQASMN